MLPPNKRYAFKLPSNQWFHNHYLISSLPGISAMSPNLICIKQFWKFRFWRVMHGSQSLHNILLSRKLITAKLQTKTLPLRELEMTRNWFLTATKILKSRKIILHTINLTKLETASLWNGWLTRPLGIPKLERFNEIGIGDKCNFES